MPAAVVTEDKLMEHDGKIIDLIRADQKPFSSLEYFPPRSESGVQNLRDRLARMALTDPLFVDFTWGAGGSTAELTLGLTLECKRRLGLRANMHVTCTNMPIEKIDDALQACRDNGITNIVALRGDPPAGQSEWVAAEGGLTCALDLVKYIRAKHGDFFNVSVAGYPEGHPDRITAVDGGLDDLSEAERGRCSVSVGEDGLERVFCCRDAAYDGELDYLKAKVDAGADLILTQMFFDTDVFARFVHACRAKGIAVPIIPGLMCINAYAGFKRMVSFCHTRVPPEVATRVEAIGQNDDEAMKAFGVEYGTEMCRRLLAGGAPGLHFYTLNLERVATGILKQLGMQGRYSEEARPEDTAQMIGMIKSAKDKRLPGNGQEAPAPPAEGVIAADAGTGTGTGTGADADAAAAAANDAAPVSANDSASVTTAAPAAAVPAAMDDYMVADASLADFGRREIELAEAQMPGLMALRAEMTPTQPLRGCRVAGSVALTAAAAVLIETLAALGADVRWCAGSTHSTQDAVAAALVAAGTAAVFAWRGQSLEEHWECKLAVLAGRRGQRGPDLVVDEGGDLALLLHEALKAEAACAEDDTLPDPSAAPNAELAVILALLRDSLMALPPAASSSDRSRSNSQSQHNPLLSAGELSQNSRNSSQNSLADAVVDGSGPGRWAALANGVAGLVEGTSAGRQRLRQMAAAASLAVAAMGYGAAVTVQEVERRGYRHAVVDALCRATDFVIAGKRVVVCGYGARGKACAAALAGAGAAVDVTEADPICALQAALDGHRVVELADALPEADMFFTTTGCKSVVTAVHMQRMKSGAVVASAGHSRDEIDVAGLAAIADRKNVKPEVDIYTFRGTKRYVLVLCDGLPVVDAAGRPAMMPEAAVTAGTAAGSDAAPAVAMMPNMVASAALTGLALALLELWRERGRRVLAEVAADTGNGGAGASGSGNGGAAARRSKYEAGHFYDLPKALDERVARLHLPSLGAKLTKLSPEQAAYMDVSPAGPFKPQAYRY